MTREEVLSLVALMENIQAAACRHFGLATLDPILAMTVHLLRRHVEGKLVTVSSLAAASGVPYTTAFRRIEQMEKNGLIVRRPRTARGLAHSLHPSRALVKAGYTFLLELRANAGSALNEDVAVARRRRVLSTVIPGPSILEQGLGVGQTLRVLAFEDPAFLAARKLADQLGHLLGGKLQFEGRQHDDLRTDILANAKRKRSRYDILVVDMPWFGELVAENVLRPLDAMQRRAPVDTTDFYPACWAAGRHGDRQYGIPFQTNAELFMYRRDLFETYGILPPVTTEDVLRIAPLLHDPQRRRYAICWPAKIGTPIGLTFMQVCADFGLRLLTAPHTGDRQRDGRADSERMRPNIEHPQAVLALEYLRELSRYAPPTLHQMDWQEPLEVFAQAEAAMTYCWSVRASRFETDRASPVRGRVGFLPHPIGKNPLRNDQRPVSPLGGFMLAIPANIDADRLDLAWRAMEWLSSPEVLKLFVQHGCLASCRLSVSADPEVREISPMFDVVDALARQGQIQTWPRPPTPEFSRVLEIVGREIHGAIFGTRRVRETLATIQTQVDALMRERGYY